MMLILWELRGPVTGEGAEVQRVGGLQGLRCQQSVPWRPHVRGPGIRKARGRSSAVAPDGLLLQDLILDLGCFPVTKGVTA